MALDATTLFLVGIFLLLGAAVLVGEIMTRLGQAALVGQLFVGIAFGPTLLGPYLGLSSSNQELAGVQLLATFFILVSAGFIVQPEEIVATGLSSGVLGLSIFLGPFLIGAVVVPLFFPAIGLTEALFVSLTLSITALPVMGVMLSEFRIGRTKMGILLMNTAVINELAAVTVFAVLLRISTSNEGSGLSIAVAALSVALFLATILSFHMGLRLFRESTWGSRVFRRFQKTWKSKEAAFALLMVMAFGVALYSQFLGLTFLVGAFYAGLLITPDNTGARIHRSLSHVFDSITWGLFIPLFFAFVGLAMNLRLLAASPLLLFAFVGLCLFAVMSKLSIGAGVARLFQWPPSEAIAIGFFVSSRGAVELAMAVILLTDGVFTVSIFTLVAAVGLVTTVVAPIGATRLGKLPREREKMQAYVYGHPEEDRPIPSGIVAK